jgi:hypothetical protein
MECSWKSIAEAFTARTSAEKLTVSVQVPNPADQARSGRLGKMRSLVKKWSVKRMWMLLCWKHMTWSTLPSTMVDCYAHREFEES